jgi:hypothetical protein
LYDPLMHEKGLWSLFSELKKKYIFICQAWLMRKL